MNEVDVIFTQPLVLEIGTGPTVAIKDCVDVAGLRTTLGSRAFANAAPAAVGAEVVQRLVSAGARLAGKVTMHELAYGVTGINPWLGTPLNPAYPGRVPGGSSSGSAAAIAAGAVDLAIGTDTGGSIRVPATCCGVAGLKPTFGLVSRAGVHPAQSSLDCVGPLARTIAGLEQAMAMIAPGFTAADRPARPLLGRVMVEADADVNAAVDSWLGAAATDVIPITLPSFSAAFQAGLIIMGAEMAELFGHLCGSGLLGPDVDARLENARTITPEAVAEAEAVRVRFAAEVDAALDTVDALVLPTMPAVPPLIADAGDAPRTLRMTALVRPFNVSGHPALSLPLLTADGLPAGLQLVGRRNEDARLCAVAAVLEGAAA